MVKDEDGKYHWISPENRDFELETTLVIRYDNHGQEIGLHDPNKKKRSKGGWTTYQLTQRKAKITWYPENWLKSYKFGYDMSAKIVVFHGSPKPHEVEDSWVKLHWK